MLRHYLQPFRRRVALLILLLLAGIGLQLIAPQVLGQFIDAASGRGDGLSGGDGSPSRLYWLAGLFFVAVLAQKALYLLTVYLTEDLGWATTNALRADLTAHVLRLDMGFHKLRTPGELIERIDIDVGELAEYFSEIVVSLIGNGLLVAGIIVLIFLEDWRIGLVALVYAAVTVTILRVVQDRMVKLFVRISQASAELLGFLEEYMTGTEDVVPNGGAGYVMSRLYPLLNAHARLRTRTYTLSTITWAAGTLLFVLTLAISMGLAASSFLAGAMSIGTVFTLVYYVGLLQSPIDDVRQHLASIQRALAGVNRTRELFDLRPEVQDATGGSAALVSGAPGVVFDGVSFAYKDRRSITNEEPADGGSAIAAGVQDIPTVLHDVSFAVAPHRVLGLLGRTGSGKTTVTRLLFRLYDVDSGHIRLGDNGGVDLRDVALSDLRRHIGMVTQDVQLFAATVRDNLTLFNADDPAHAPLEDGRIIAALESLGLGGWYRDLPDGLDTVLESGGKGLSAGEAQLLAFARVFLRDPRLVVLDEASSRLDPGTERLLEQAIDRLLEGRTGLIVAHRLRTVQRADDVVILENGRVVEFGQRVVLAADPNSRFHQLLQTGLEEVLA